MSSLETKGLKYDLTGNHYGTLFVVSHSHRNKLGAWWVCACFCGNIVTLSTNTLRCRPPKTCGRCSNHRTKHGMGKTKLYYVWAAMLHRCRTRTNQFFQRYGGRGISVCKEWYNFEPFMRWALTHGYKEGLCLDRINNDGNYTLRNCRFITPLQSHNNKSTTFWITHNNETSSLSDWSRKTGIQPKTLRERIARGWDIEKALTTPPKPRGHY